MTHRTILLALMIGVTTISGCVTWHDPSSNLPPSSFHLIYESTIEVKATGATHGYRFTFTLEQTDLIHDVDGTLVEGYRLEYRSDAYTDYTFYYLDTDWRIIRVDQLCASLGDDPCELIDISWVQRGLLPAFGIGLPALLNTEPAATAMTGSPHLIELPHGRGPNGDLWIQIKDPPVRGTGSIEGTYWYRDDEPFPYLRTHEDEITTSTDTLIEAKKSGPIPEITPHFPTALTTPKRDYFLYPGDDADLYRRGWTVSDAYERLLTDRPSVAATMDSGGCVLEVFHSYTVLEAPAPILEPVMGSATIHTAMTIQDDQGEAEIWNIDWYRYGVLEPSVSTYRREANDSPRPSCEDVLRSPPMRHSMLETWDLARGFFGDCLPQLWTRYWIPISWESPEPGDGWGQLSVWETIGSCGPISSGWARPMVMDAHTGWFTNIRLTVEEYQEWETHKGPIIR